MEFCAAELLVPRPVPLGIMSLYFHIGNQFNNK